MASALQVGQVCRKWVKCVASGSGVLQEQVCQVGQVCCKWGKWWQSLNYPDARASVPSVPTHLQSVTGPGLHAHCHIRFSHLMPCNFGSKLLVLALSC